MYILFNRFRQCHTTMPIIKNPNAGSDVYTIHIYIFIVLSALMRVSTTTGGLSKAEQRGFSEPNLNFNFEMNEMKKKAQIWLMRMRPMRSGRHARDRIYSYTINAGVLLKTADTALSFHRCRKYHSMCECVKIKRKKKILYSSILKFYEHITAMYEYRWLYCNLQVGQTVCSCM